MEDSSTSIPTKVKNAELVRKRREQIILAAIKLFGKNGFYKTTLRELAEEAGISQGNIYDYVGNKEDIFFLIHEFLANHLNEGLDQSVKHVDDPIEKLRRIIREEFNLAYEWADAILLLYQEGHILPGHLLKKFLASEREHVTRFEQPIKEGMERGLVRSCNARVAANLIKTMVDSWILKRWDLWRHVTQLEMEKSILDLVFYGLLQESESKQRTLGEKRPLEGKSVIYINGGTVLGESIAAFLFSAGARIAIFVDDTEGSKTAFHRNWETEGKRKIYSAIEHGPMTSDLLTKIIRDSNPVDVLIHDLSAHNGRVNQADSKKTNFECSEANLMCAQHLAGFLEVNKLLRMSSRILYIAPWAWEKLANRFRYEIVKSGTVALTREMAKRMAPQDVQVNCIVPGFIKTPSATVIQKAQAKESAKMLPFGHMGDITDIIDAILFFVHSGKYLTGQVLEIAGGAFM